MLIGINSQYLKIAFDNEAEIEKVVTENAELLFGRYAIVLPKKKLTTIGGKGTIPDAIVVDLAIKAWYIVEMERAVHGTWEHIAPQVSKQLTAVLKPETLELILSMALAHLNSNQPIKDVIVDELQISEINIHGTINSILKKPPIVAIPIDDIPLDLTEWASTLKHDVRIWRIEKYSRIGGKADVLYSFPDDHLPDVKFVADGSGFGVPQTNQSGGQLLSKVIKAGLLKVGEVLTMEYGPKGKSKQKFTAVVRDDGLEVEGKVYSPSYAAVACMQKAGSTSKTANGWITWKNAQGKLISDLLKQLAPEE
jgi:hypothetical protein